MRKRDDQRLYAVKEIAKQKVAMYDKIDAVFRERDLLEESSANPMIVRLECSF